MCDPDDYEPSIYDVSGCDDDLSDFCIMPEDFDLLIEN